jgi:hypothetical protein
MVKLPDSAKKGPLAAIARVTDIATVVAKVA